MKIGIDVRILAEKRTGKASQLAYILPEMLKNNEHEFFLYTKGDLPRELSTFSAQTVHNNLPGLLWHMWCAYHAFQKAKVDVFFATSSYIVPALKDRCVIVVHDMVSFLKITKHNKKATIIERLTLKKAAKKANAIIAVSQNTKKDIQNICKISEEKISVVYEAIHPSFYEDVEDKEKERVKQKYEINGKYIFFLSTLEPRKNIVNILKAYERLRGEIEEPPQLVMAGGKGWNIDEFEAVLAELKHKKNVILPGYVDHADIRALYQGAELYVFPAKYEGFGLTVLEAMASKKAVITSRVSALPEIGGEAVLYVDHANINEITSAMKKVLTDSELKKDLEKKAFARAQMFDIKKAAKETLEVIINEGE